MAAFSLFKEEKLYINKKEVIILQESKENQ